jgi:hypothetical protein
MASMGQKIISFGVTAWVLLMMIMTMMKVWRIKCLRYIEF